MKRLIVLLLLALPVMAHAADNAFHPPFPLLDANGRQVLASGAAMDEMQTCGDCHNVEFIRDSSDHIAAGVFDDSAYRCLTCHSDFEPPQDWSTLPFEPDGSLAASVLDVHKPRDRNCANCHAVVNNRLDDPLTVAPDPADFSMTDRTGEIIAAQRVSASGLNIAGKNDLTHPFDVHADRVVNCVNCHYSLNNPVYYRQRDDDRPSHLDFDPRRLTLAEYLQRPLHQLAKGSSRDGLGAFESANSMRRCESCHDATAVHEWLPYKRRHFASLACEACHIPKLYGPALQTRDWTVVDADGNPRERFRDVDGDPATADSLIHGFRPVMLARENVGGERKLAPFNLVTNWYWRDAASGEAIAPERLRDALYSNGAPRPDVQRLLDTDGDGRIDDAEAVLGTADRVDAVRQLLADAGLDGLLLAGEVAPYSISHNVVNGRWANRDCHTCHGADSVLAAPFSLGDYRPGDALPVLASDAGVTLGGAIEPLAAGAVLLPSTWDAGYYVIGLDGLDLVDKAGLVMFFGILFGVGVHGLGRFIASRRRPRVHYPTRRVKLYDAYDRIWHWLQAGTILLLILTGLIIHKPHIFGMFSFAYVVQVHNVLGFILLINAALALFYTVASGTIRRFFPNPDGFMARAFEQTMFYTRGIFAGAPHPLQKTPQNRLNVLQQLTYLAILNVLLPAQVVTGLLIWGIQYSPALSDAIGGLTILAPLHTFLAWAFAAFIVMHVYLTTTGETPLAGIRSMVTGWEDVEQHGATNTSSDEETAHV
ncbi:MAG: cytochrome b/b6 domain-containing protein [Xanthomonadales bacterium]